MIIFSCFVPHSPLLIPEIGKENLDKFKKTIEAYKQLEHELYSSNPDTIILISSHASTENKAFTINQQPGLEVDFKNFGDLITKLEFTNDFALGYKIKESSETTLPIILTSNKTLDYGTGVPLFLLSKKLKNTKIISIGYGDLSSEQHIEFGKIIKEEINKSDKRVGIIASGDLSHRLHQDSPDGYSPRAQEFDQTIIKLLQENKVEDIINLDKELIKEAGECGYRSLLILLGIIQNINFKAEKLSYEAPFDIGYLVENFKIN